MTREEAIIHIGTLRTVTKDIPKYSGKAIDEAVDMAIKALEQESYEDAEIQKMQELEQAEIEKAYELGKSSQPKTGHWIPKGIGDGFKKWNCSKCGIIVRNSQRPWYKYCPDCGCRMESEVEDADR